MRRETAYPVPTVRLIVRDADGRVLILRRSQGTAEGGRWCLPGGKVDYGATVEAAAAKELAEETGLTCASARFLFLQDSLPATRGSMHCLNLYFECTASGSVALNDESDDFAWIAPEDLPGYALVFLNDEGLRQYWQLEPKNQDMRG